MEKHKPEMDEKIKQHDRIMAGKIKKDTDPLTKETWKNVLKHLKKKDKNIFKHINKACQEFKDAMFEYFADFILNEFVPETYDYTKLFGLWKQKGSEIDLNMMWYIHGKEWDAKLLEARISERMKPHINKNCPDIQIGGIAGNTSTRVR